MSRDKREPEYPAELESQFILRLPEEPAKNLREALRSGENLKSRLNIQIENDMRNGEVRVDNVVMQAKIVDLPTIIESLKTIDNKSFYKTADICQMMICKEDADPTVTEEESPTKSKKKDPYKVDKKFLWPHGITPPTKNVRKRRFRKTLKKKCIEAPEIEKEVKRLLRADNEAIKVTWEVINEEDEHQSIPETVHQSKSSKKDRKKSLERKSEKKSIEKKSSEKSSEKKSSEKKSSEKKSSETKSSEKSSESKGEKKSKGSKKKQAAKSKKSSNVVDIFGGAVSDSENEEHHINVDIDETRFSGFDSRLSVNSSLLGIGDTSTKRNTLPIEFQSQMFGTSHSSRTSPPHTVTSTITSAQVLSDDEDNRSQDSSKDSMTVRIEQVRQQLEELKSRRQRTQHEITGMENMALKQRFKDILHTLNQDVMYKEMEYQGLITLQNSEDI